MVRFLLGKIQPKPLLNALAFETVSSDTNWIGDMLDLGAESAFQRLIAPLGIFLFLVILACWIVLRLHGAGVNQYTDGPGSDPGSFFGGDSDC